VTLSRAFIGPLSKVPGPFYMKFTAVPWAITCINGEQMNVAPELFKKYGNIIRVGKLRGWKDSMVSD
jgi:hypothetical protein